MRIDTPLLRVAYPVSAVSIIHTKLRTTAMLSIKSGQGMLCNLHPDDVFFQLVMMLLMT
jgi:hypothetical protein